MTVSEADGQASIVDAGVSITVLPHRIDDIMDQLGELVVAQARLVAIAKEVSHPTLDETAEEIERLVTALRDATSSIRMLPLESVFSTFRRFVRDLSSEHGKSVALETQGGETEVDKAVIDSLAEPLLHIIRNAIVRGVEPSHARRAAGKPEQATILLKARQVAGEVVISVRDDGAGLDSDAILKRDVIAADAETSAGQIVSCDVEVDAVRQAIEDLRGSIDVRTQAGSGTEVTLRLPLTLASIDGLLFKVGGGSFVLPLTSVEECVELPHADSRRESGRPILHIRSELVPYLNLETLFGFESTVTEDRQVVITNVAGRRMGFVVDEVIGHHQTVARPLSLYHRGLAGSTILGDGSVALILDPAAIIKRAQNEQRRKVA